MTWVVVDDPIPAGASHLGAASRANRKSRFPASRIRSVPDGHPRRTHRGVQQRSVWPDFVERPFNAFRAYYDTCRRVRSRSSTRFGSIRSVTFQLPPTQVEALYSNRRCSARFRTLRLRCSAMKIFRPRVIMAGSHRHRRDLRGDVALIAPKRCRHRSRSAGAMATVGRAIARSQRRADLRKAHRSPRTATRMDATG